MATRFVFELHPYDADGHPSREPALRVSTVQAFAAAVEFYCSAGSYGFAGRRVEES